MFKKNLRVRRETFEHILNSVRSHLEKTPTDMKPHPISVERQLALTLCRLAHAASYNELEDVFGISVSLGCKTFNKVVRVLVATMYDVYVSLPVTKQQHGMVSTCISIQNSKTILVLKCVIPEQT